MAKPTNTGAGTLVVPMVDFNIWLQTYYLKPPEGTFVSWGKVKVKGTDELEAQYTLSTVAPPAPPA